MLLARIMITKLHAVLPFTSLKYLKVCTLNLKLNGKVIKSLLIVSLRYCIRWKCVPNLELMLLFLSANSNYLWHFLFAFLFNVEVYICNLNIQQLIHTWIFTIFSKKMSDLASLLHRIKVHGNSTPMFPMELMTSLRVDTWLVGLTKSFRACAKLIFELKS